MKYKFAVQSTNNAHINPADHLFITETRHTTLSAARKQLNQQMAAMHRSCGPNAWYCNYRIIALVDTPMSTHLDCNGAHIGYRTENCPTSACSDVSWVWPGGATELFIYVPGVDARSGEIALPAGWYGCDQCEACHAREREMENVEYQSA